jgi:hypothetical protein
VYRRAASLNNAAPQGRQKNFNADDRRCTRNTQMVSYCSSASDHAFDFQAWFAEIEQRAGRQAGRFQINGALHPPCCARRHSTVIVHFYAAPLLHREANIA